MQYKDEQIRPDKRWTEAHKASCGHGLQKDSSITEEYSEVHAGGQRNGGCLPRGYFLMRMMTQGEECIAGYRIVIDSSWTESSGAGRAIALRCVPWLPIGGSTERLAPCGLRYPCSLT